MESKIYTRGELEKKLTQKEHDFCHLYIIEWNGADSARKAGYSENSAKETAYENLTKPHIKQYIDFIKNDIAKEAGISKLSIINELKILAFSNLPKIILKYEKGGLDSLTEDEQKCIIEYTEDKRQVGEGEESVLVDSKVRFKLDSKRSSLTDILKSMGWNEADKVVADVNVKSIDISSLTEEEKKLYLKLSRNQKNE